MCYLPTLQTTAIERAWGQARGSNVGPLSPREGKKGADPGKSLPQLRPEM